MERAVELYTQAAEQGEHVAACNLAYLHEIGDGVHQDLPRAAYWYTVSAKKGYPRAQYQLARCYEHGRGVPQDDAQAEEWYAKAAESRYQDAADCASRMRKKRQKSGFLGGIFNSKKKNEKK